MSDSDDEKVKLFVGAAISGNEALFHQLINEGVDVNGKVYGSQAIHWAARAGQVKIIELLLNSGSVCIDCIGSYNQTPLHYAVKDPNLKRLETIELLVSRNANCQIPADGGNTPLHDVFLQFSECCYSRHNNCAQSVETESTAIHYCLATLPDTITNKCRWLGIAAFLVTHSNGDLTITNEDGETPLDIISSDYFEFDAITSYFKELQNKVALIRPLIHKQVCLKESVCQQIEKLEMTIEDVNLSNV